MYRLLPLIILLYSLSGCNRKYTETENQQIIALSQSIKIMENYANSIHLEHLHQMESYHSEKRLKNWHELHLKLTRYARHISFNNLNNKCAIDSINMLMDTLSRIGIYFNILSKQMTQLNYQPVNDSLEYLILKATTLSLTLQLQEFMTSQCFITYNPINEYHYLFIPQTCIQANEQIKIAVVPHQYTYLPNITYCKLTKKGEVIEESVLQSDHVYFESKKLTKGEYVLECKGYNSDYLNPDSIKNIFPLARNSYHFEIK